MIDRALESGDPQLEQDAAALLESNAARLLTSDGRWAWPTAVELKWPLDVHLYARQNLLDALIGVLAARKPDEWDGDLVSWLVLQFDLVRASEKRNNVGAGAVLALQLVLHSKHYPDNTADLITARGTVKIEGSKVELLVPWASTEVGSRTAKKIEDLWPEWVVDGTPPPMEALTAKLTAAIEG